ncbi:hypothetical protein L484_006103 [Morus notabilis]|uniref:Uncharacterized protein n=1 Tax=Morus notabilis TaxID=981085 RepID=W9SAR1_9ROSA|nr:hypothetical protein L484_006103 [Morus notabilis]
MPTEVANHRISNVLNDLQDTIEDVNDEVDPREYYVTPPTSVVNDNDTLLPQSGVFDEAMSTVDCRPFRRKKLSAYLQSPYTDLHSCNLYRNKL